MSVGTRRVPRKAGDAQEGEGDDATHAAKVALVHDCSSTGTGSMSAASGSRRRVEGGWEMGSS